jgi:hypothetical protein
LALGTEPNENRINNRNDVENLEERDYEGTEIATTITWDKANEDH